MEELLLKTKTALGLEYLYPIQQHVILNSFEKKDQIVILPTGSGKSVCFMGAIVNLPGIHILMYPLLALMSDQYRRFIDAGIEAVILRGGQTRSERKQIFKNITKAKQIAVITNPETLLNANILQRFEDSAVRQIIIDEAHTISEWGEEFRPACLEVGTIINTLKPDFVSAYTATASETVIDKITRYIFPSRNPTVIEEIPDRTNVHYSLIRTLSKEHSIKRIVNEEDRPMVIYFRSRRRVEEICIFIKQHFPYLMVMGYHAGMSKKVREEVEQNFFRSTSAILCATTAYGLGINKGNIRTVLHYEMAPNIEAYLQESGRAGRDRAASKAIMLISNSDIFHTQGKGSQREKDLCSAFLRNACLRESLLKLMGHNLQHCHGCDFCHGIATQHLSSIKVDKVMAKKSKRNYAFLLKGLWNLQTIADNAWIQKDFGKLFDLSTDEIIELIENSLIKLPQHQENTAAEKEIIQIEQ